MYSMGIKVNAVYFCRIVDLIRSKVPSVVQAMNGQYLCNRQITVSYAYKKDTKGERHGTPAGNGFSHYFLHTCNLQVQKRYSVIT